MSFIKRKIISSAQGKITKLLMVFENEEGYQSLLKAFLPQLHQHTQVIFWANKSDEKETLDKLLQSLKDQQLIEGSLKSRFIVLSPEAGQSDLSKWARDPFVVLQNDGDQRPDLIESSNQNGNEELAELLSRKKIIRKVAEWLLPSIEGGNILVDDQFVMIGENQYYGILDEIQIPNIDISLPNFLQNRITTLLDPDNNFLKRIYIIGKSNIQALAFNKRKNFISHAAKANTDVPFPHLDMYLTLTGCRDENNRYIIFLGQPIAVQESSMDEAHIKEVYLQNILNLLESENFKVYRNPMPIIIDDQDNTQYECYYNNCLVEKTNTQKTVWLPTYGTGKWASQLQSFDLINQRLWEYIGFEVRMIKADFHSLSRHRGVLHCLTNELERI